MERFLLPTSDFPPKRGGVARMLSAFATHVPNVRVLTVSEHESYGSLLKKFWDRRVLFDVIFVSHVLPIGVAALLYRCFTGTPYNILLHGLDFDLARLNKKKSVILWLILRFARDVFANSGALAKEVADFSRRSCKVMYPCVTDEFVEASALIGERSGSGTRLLTVGRLVERKGHMKVLNAMIDRTDFTYTIVGDGPMKAFLMEEVERLQLSDRVTFLQSVSDGKLPEMYASHDIFVMPTTKTDCDREGFGIVYLEAGLFGLPVIATNQPGVNEAVVDGDTGLLIEDTPHALLEALDRLSQDQSLRIRLAHNAKQRVLRFFTASKTYGDFTAGEQKKSWAPSLISVVIPTYQHARSLPACIDSIFRQTYPNIEVIVVDDGSTDDTQEVLRSYGKKITSIYQENRGGNAARNRGLAAVKGEYVIFVDADVVLRCAALDVMFDALQEHVDASYAYSGFRFGWKRFRGVSFDENKLRRSNFVMTTSLVRRKDFPGFDESLRRLQDWDVWLTMLEQGKKGVLVPGVWFSVIIDGESRTGSSWLPSFMYQLSWPIFGWTPKRIVKYREAREVIAKKHKLLV